MIPRTLSRLAQRLLVGPHREFVLGDLDEGYERLAATRGAIVATVWFVAMMFRSAYTIRRQASHTRNRRWSGIASIFDGALGDFRLGLRLVRKHPAVSLTATVVMTLGIGVATLAFGVHYQLFRGLPVEAPHRMVAITSTIPEQALYLTGLSVDDFADFRAVQTTMSDMALWDAYVQANFGTGDAPPEQITVTIATASLHRLLELSPLHGRLFVEEDDLEHAPRVAVLSESFWQRRFGGDANVMGRTVSVAGEAVTIVGVLPVGAGFEYEDLFLPLRIGQSSPDRRGRRPFMGLARLREGATLREANKEIQMLAARIGTAHPTTNKGVSARVLPFAESRIGSASGYRLLSLTGALILLIAIANVSNLFLVRALARSRELQLRLAIGASRWRVLRHFLAEAAVPVVAGAMGGAVLAKIALPWYGSQYRFEIAHGVFVFIVACAAMLLIGIISGMQAIRRTRDLSPADGTRGNTRRQFSRVGQGLVVAQIAAGGAALFVAGLMVKTAVNLQRIDYGFAIDDVITGTVLVDTARYTTPETRLAFWDTFRARAKAIPGVREATLATQLPMIRYRGWARFRVDGQTVFSDADYFGSYRDAITPEFFDTFDKTLLQGRAFTEADGPDAEPVVIVNEDFVRRFLRDGDALGRRIRLQGSDQPWMRVVGIAPHMWMDTDVDQFPQGMYVPLAQHDPSFATIAMRVSGNPEDYVGVLRETLMGLDPNIPLDEAMTMSALIHLRTTSYRSNRPRYTFFGAVGLVLSVVGLYGVMSYIVRARTQEIGIRMALGAQRTNVLHLILRQGVAQIAGGVVLGVGVALYVSNGMSRLVFQMSPWDPWVLGLSFGILAVTAFVATLVPARRATRVDPLVALRVE